MEDSLNPELPRAILGTLFEGKADPHAFSPDEFHLPAHAAILEGIKALRAKGICGDFVLLRDWLETQGHPEGLTNAEIGHLIGNVLVPENFAHYVAVFRREAAKDRTKRAMLEYVAAADEMDESEAAARFAALEQMRKPVHVGTLLPASHLLERVFNAPDTQPVPWGLEAMSGLRVEPSDLCVVAARPGAGKTAMLGTVAIAAARQGWSVVIFSLEMPRIQIQRRLLAGISRAHLSGIVARTDASVVPYTNGPEWKRIFIEDGTESSLTLERIVAQVRAMPKAGNTVVLVDYLQLVTTRARYEKRYEVIGHVCRELKACAKASGVPIIAAAQLGRAAEQRGKDAAPLLSDLRESGEIENTADQVVLLHRGPDGTKAAVAKYRNGETFAARLEFNGPLCLFEDPPNAAPW